MRSGLSNVKVLAQIVTLSKADGLRKGRGGVGKGGHVYRVNPGDGGLVEGCGFLVMLLVVAVLVIVYALLVAP